MKNITISHTWAQGGYAHPETRTLPPSGPKALGEPVIGREAKILI